MIVAIQPGRQHGIDIGAIIRNALRRATSVDWMPQKEAAITMGTSMSQLSQALDGKSGYPLDLWKFAELPAKLQHQVYARILERAYEREWEQRRVMAKAELLPRDEERKLG